MPEQDKVLWAKYPFTKGAREFVIEKGIRIDQILTSSGYEESLRLAVERVKGAVSSERRASTLSATKGVLEIYAYPIARIIVSLLAEPGIIKFYARAEARRMVEYLNSEEDKRGVVLWILKELGVSFSVKNGDVLIPIPQYLQVAPSHEDYKLVNQVLGSGENKGYVVIRNEKSLIAIAENAFRLKIEDELPIDVDESTRNIITPYMKDISEQIYQAWVRPVEETGEVILEAMPPCMHALLDYTQQGGEITHQGRFALTSFLCAIGLKSNEIIELYRRRPDFRYDLTKYQVEHISGNISSTKYTPPECNTMRTYGLCTNMDSLCQREWMKHPLIYYRVKKKDLEGKKQEP